MKTTLVLAIALFAFQQISAQKFVIQETNTTQKKTASQYLTIAKKCEMVLLKKQTLYTLPISAKSTLTNNSIAALGEKFQKAFPKEIDPLKGEEKTVVRGYDNKSDDIVQLTYCVLLPNQFQTSNYVQMIVYFDSSGPNPLVKDIKVKNNADLGIITLTEREIHPPVVKATPPPAKAPAKTTTKKPAAKKPAAKKK